MKKLLKWFENTMSAVTFAEEGEFETAREILREEKRTQKKVAESKKDIRQITLEPETQVRPGGAQTKRLWKRLEDSIASIAFAKTGDIETAKEILRKVKQPLSEESKELEHKADSTLSIIDDLTSMAITFAEAGEFKIAWELLNEAEDSVKRVMKAYKKGLSEIILNPKMSST